MSTLTPIFNGIEWEVSQIIPNATIEPFPQNNNANSMPAAFRITPNEGYVLHDKGRDYIKRTRVTDENGSYVYDENGDPVYVETFYRGYTSGRAICNSGYDFTPLQIELEGETVTAYGAFKEYCAVLRASIQSPENQIFGGGVTPETEVM